MDHPSSSECRQLPYEYLPSQTAKASQHLSAQAVAMPLYGPLADVDFSLLLTEIHPPGFGPPLVALPIKLRI